MVRIREIKMSFHLFVARVMKTIAYLRVSTGSQDLANQKLAVLDYARQKRFAIDRFVEAQASSREGRDQRRIEELLGTLAAGDRLVVRELSRLGRRLGQVIQIVDELVKRKVRFTAIKESIRFEGKQDLQTKVMIALFGLFAEVERDLISERTKEGLASARAQGRLLGRPKGVLGQSKLDGKEGEIRMLLEKEVSKASVAKIVGVSRTALRHFIRTRKLDPTTSRGRGRGCRPWSIFSQQSGRYPGSSGIGAETTLTAHTTPGAIHPGRQIETSFTMSWGAGTAGSSSFRLVLHGPHHRRRRLLPESLLDSPHVRISQTGQDLVRAGEGQEVVPDLTARSIPFDKEPLLPRPGVVGERTVSETEPPDRPRFIHDVHDPAGVQPPQADLVDNHRHDLAGQDHRFR